MVGTTVVYSKKVFLKVIEELIKDDEFVVISNILNSITAGNKKKHLKVSMGINQYSFLHPDSIVDVLNSKVFGLVVCKKELLAKELQKEDSEIEQENKNKKKVI